METVSSNSPPFFDSPPIRTELSEAVPPRTALWGSVVHGVDADGWCRTRLYKKLNMKMLEDVGRCWKM